MLRPYLHILDGNEKNFSAINALAYFSFSITDKEKVLYDWNLVRQSFKNLEKGLRLKISFVEKP
jgi:hypothetical protein